MHVFHISSIVSNPKICKTVILFRWLSYKIFVTIDFKNVNIDILYRVNKKHEKTIKNTGSFLFFIV